MKDISMERGIAYNPRYGNDVQLLKIRTTSEFQTFRISDFQNFPGEHAPDPLECLYLGTGVPLSNFIIGCHTFPQLSCVRSYYVENMGKV